MSKPLDLSIYTDHSTHEFAITIRDMELNTHFKQNPNNKDQFFDPRWPNRMFTRLFKGIDSNSIGYQENVLDIMYKANGYKRVTVKGS
jgi:hypothetical protein